MKHYLLTGATGVIGSAVLRNLIETGERVTILVRATSPEHLNRRVSRLHQFVGFRESEKILVNPIEADLYQPCLGLPPDVYQALVRQTTHILHCAGNVAMNLSLDAARDQTMTMTRNVVNLMEKSAQVQKMVYVSTVGVAGETPGNIPEDWIVHDRGFRNSYEAAKSEAELFIRQKIEQGLNITVIRPSMVIGNAQTGKNISFQVFYYLCEFLSGAKTRGLVPDLTKISLDVIPSDYVGDLIYWASCRDRRLPAILHACSGPELSIGLDDLADYVRKIYRKNGNCLPGIKKVPLPLYRIFIRSIMPFASGKAKRSLNTLPLFLSYLKTPQFFMSAGTRNLAGADGIELPEPFSYIDRSLEYYLKIKKIAAG